MIADALDNLPDAMSYAISYFAVGQRQRWKAAAAVKGLMLLVLAGGILFDAWNRFREGPRSLCPTMVAMALIAVALNYWCVRILRARSKDDVNLRAAWTMSLNDFASNLGIIGAGMLVAWLGTNWPDLLLAIIIAVIAAYGGIATLRDTYLHRVDDAA